MQTQKKTLKSSSTPIVKRPLFWVLIVVLVAAGVAAFLVNRHQTGTKAANDVNPPNTINYNPPTEEEKKATEEFKQKQQEQASDPPAPTPTPAADGRVAVVPTISYIGQYDASVEASAFISTVFEDGGTCTLTLKKGSSTVTKTSQGVKDARSTRCSLFSFPAKELSSISKGTWTATVSYSSTTSAGTSQPSSLEVK